METSGEFDIYNKDKRYKSAIRLLLDADFSKRDKDIILEFVRHKKRQEDIGIHREVKLLNYLRRLREELGVDFESASKKDIERLHNIVEGRRRMGQISRWTRYDMLTILRQIYRYLGKTELVEDIKIRRPEIEELHPDEILTWDDVVLMSKYALSERDKALVQVLWDSGLRIEELLTMRIKDAVVKNHNSAVELHIRKSKTKRRSPIIVRSAPALLSWIEKHPLKDDRDAPLWVNLTRPYSLMKYSTVRKVLKTLKERSGLKKRVNPHMFRKSSASFYCGLLTESEIKERFGWKQSSKMLDIYLHPNEREINKKIMKLHGLKVDDDEEIVKDEEMPKKCLWCSTLNPAGQEFCTKCKRPLDPEEGLMIANAIEGLDQEMKDMLNMEFTQMLEKLKVKIAKEIMKAKKENSVSIV